ncbi:MAG: GNAT family N-acetyltransferase [Eubacteriales bacterium]|nr:GNAT family N-acetyltransferase [Eubacteriales bacterium]
MEERTNHYSLRPLELKDADRMLEWMQNRDITRFLQIGGPETTKDHVLSFIQHSAEDQDNLHRAIVDDTDTYLGTVSLKHIDREKREAEYAIAMHNSALGTGASADGSRLILQTAFEELGLQRVYLYVLEENQRAIRFYNKMGFQYTHSSTIEHKGKKKTLMWFEILRDARPAVSEN